MLELVPPDLAPRGTRLYPVGRLDLDSEGLLLLTNDGEWTDRVLHPRYGVEREYAVAVGSPLGREQREALAAGIQLEEGIARARRAAAGDADGDRPRSASSWSRGPPRARRGTGSILAQGWKRQVRRMFAAVGAPVERLVRVRVGTLRLDLPSGAARPARPAEVRRLGAAAPGRRPARIIGTKQPQGEAPR